MEEHNRRWKEEEKGENRVWRAKSSIHCGNRNRQANNQGRNRLHSIRGAKSSIYWGITNWQANKE
ncbi:hypothetical protein TIFTF001_052755, partial [Ficus carica]